MKWTFLIKHKLAASVSLFALCLLVLFSLYMDSRHTRNVRENIRTLYADRLLAELYIMKLNSDLFRIKEIMNADELYPDDKIQPYLKQIQVNVTKYQATRLTSSEQQNLLALKNSLNIINGRQGDPSAVNAVIEQAIGHTEALSSIQIEESKLIMGQSDKLYLISKSSAQFAFAVCIIILMVLQALVFASRSIGVRYHTGSHGLN